VHELECKLLLVFLMAFHAHILFVPFDQESFIGSMGGMASRALAFGDRRMDNRPRKLFPRFLVTGTANVFFRPGEAERVRSVGRLVAVRAELFCHGYMGDSTGQCLFIGSMRIMAVGTALDLNGITGMRLSESELGTVVTPCAQIGSPFFQETGLIRRVGGMTSQAISLSHGRMDIFLHKFLFFVLMTVVTEFLPRNVEQIFVVRSVRLMAAQAQPLVHRPVLEFGIEGRRAFIVAVEAVPVSGTENQIGMIGGMRVVAAHTVARLDRGMSNFALPRVFHVLVACVTELLVVFSADYFFACS
jgi:hypothetical protein